MLGLVSEEAEARGPEQVVRASDPVDGTATVVAVAGCLGEPEAEHIHRVIERALMRTGERVTVDLEGLTAFTLEGIAELSRAMRAGERLPGGIRLVLRSPQSKAAVVALCRQQSDHSTA